MSASEHAARKIIHCDCDCFYAAIEARDDPALADRPVAVGGRPDQRGVVATCNYPARQFGIHSAMAMAQAIRRCPDLVIIRPNMQKYRTASHQILGIYREFTERVEPLSLDEAYLDVTGSLHEGGSATRIASAIKQRVRAEVGITVSAGVAGNKFLAKIASDWRKPDGLFVVRPDDADAFVAALPIEKIHGVGSVTAAKMRAHGMQTCADVRLRSRLELRSLFGVLGDRVHDLALGIDRREVTPERERKSLSVEETYVQDLQSLDECRRELALLVERLVGAAGRLDEEERIQGVFVKIRFDDFRKTTVERVGESLELGRFFSLLETGWQRANRPVRLLGVGARIGAPRARDQLPLFEGPR